MWLTVASADLFRAHRAYKGLPTSASEKNNITAPRDQPSLRLVNQRLSGTRIGANAQRQNAGFSIQPSINISRPTPPG
jgi:hypothetical protein